MTTKKKAAARARARGATQAQLEDVRLMLVALSDQMGRGFAELNAQLVSTLHRMKADSARRRVFVLLIGEYLQREPGRFVRREEADEDTTPEWARRPAFVPERPAAPKIVRGFLSATSETIEHDDGWHRAAVRLDDPGQRLWAPGAWLIAFNAGVLSNVKIGDLAQGNGVDSPIVQLNAPIQPGQLVQAMVRLETFAEPHR